MQETTFRFSDGQRDAVVYAIGYGPYQGEPMRIVKRLERFAARYHSRVVEPGLRPAIIEAEKITQFVGLLDGLTRSDGLWCVLPKLDRQHRRRIARWLGNEYHHLEDDEGHRVRRGKEILSECRALTDDLRKAAEYARLKAYSEVWNSEELEDREFRALCLSIANTWYDISMSALPDVSHGVVPRSISDHGDGDRNALWITLDALEIHISDHMLKEVVEFIDGELFTGSRSS